MTKHVADTHAFIWMMTDERARLGRRAARIVDRAAHGLGEIHVSAASLHEVSMLLDRRRLRIEAGWSWWLERVRQRRGLIVQPVLVEDVDASRAFGSVADPFDRLVAGTALRLGVPLLTADEEIRASAAVEVVW